MTDRVTLYRVRRPDGTVIPAPPRDHRYAAVVSASYSEQQLSNLILAADEDQKFDDYLKITGYTIEAIQYAPVNPEREVLWTGLVAEVEALEGQIESDAAIMAENDNMPANFSEREVLWKELVSLLSNPRRFRDTTAAVRYSRIAELRCKLGIEEG